MIEHNGIPWSFYHRMLIPKVAPHIDVGLDKGAAEQLIARHHALLVRWVSDFDCRFPTEWWYVIKDGKVNIDDLSGNSRSNLRRGLKRCYVSRLNADYIANNAFPVYKNAFAGYKTHQNPLSQKQFMESILRNPRKDLVDYWGVFDQDDKKIIGYSRNSYHNDACEYIESKYDPDYLKNYSSIVLFFEMCHYYLNERGALYVSNGQRTISHDTNIHEFLIQRLNFRKAYCRLNIVYSPLMRVIVNILFPFRSLFSPLNENLSALLKQEEIQRSF
jgi:hypothetical protein